MKTVKIRCYWSVHCEFPLQQKGWTHYTHLVLKRPSFRFCFGKFLICYCPLKYNVKVWETIWCKLIAKMTFVWYLNICKSLKLLIEYFKIYKARHVHKRSYTVLPKYSKIQVLPGITSCRLVKDNKQAIELNSLLINNMPKDGYEWS